MPEMPIAVANLADRAFSRPANVASVTQVSPLLRRVQFVVPHLRGTALELGCEVEFRVSNTAFRHYTPASWNPKEGVLDIVFYLHGKGPGSLWATELAPHVPVRMMGPGRAVRLASSTTRLLGDETCIGLFEALQTRTPTHDVTLEVHQNLVEDLRRTYPDWEILPRTTPGAALCETLQQPSQAQAFLLGGHAQSIQRWRRLLLGRGVARRAIRTRAYWSDTRRGL